MGSIRAALPLRNGAVRSNIPRVRRVAPGQRKEAPMIHGERVTLRPVMKSDMEALRR